MRPIFCCLFLSVALVSNAQIQWEYGVNANFNVAFIKPSVSDSFTNKAGYGGGLFLETSKGKYSLQLAPSFAKTSYINDNSLTTTDISSLDVSLDFMYTPEAKTNIYFVGGLAPAISFAHTEKRLDGSKSSGLSTKTKSGINPFDLGIKLGVSMELNEGVRFQAYYLDFINGTQKAGSISGRVDYLQFGIQLRFKELMDGTKATDKRLQEQTDIQATAYHLSALRSTSTLLFTLPPKSDEKQTENRQIQEDAIRKWIVSAVHLNYRAGSFAVIDHEELQAAFNGDSVRQYNAIGNASLQALDTSFYVARIGEVFIGNNTKLSWGISVYDSYMHPLKYPFPVLIPYRNIDSSFKNEASVVRMISELNEAILTDP